MLAGRPPPRLVGAIALILAFAGALALEPSATIPLAQSAVPGVLLWVAALSMNGYLERRGHLRRPAVPIPSTSPAASIPPSGLTINLPAGVGADESTAIRPRALSPSSLSTGEHIVLSRPPIIPAEDPSAAVLRDPR